MIRIGKFTDFYRDVTKEGTKIPQEKYLQTGLYPVIDQGRQAVAGRWDSDDGIFKEVPAIVFGDHTRAIKYIEEPFFIGADGVKILRPVTPQDNPKYLFYALQAARIPDLGYSRHFKAVKELEIRVYSTAEQNEIVRILEKTDSLIEQRYAEVAYIDLLVKSRFIELFGDYDLSHPQESWVAIKEIGTVVGGATPKTDRDEYWGGSFRWITPAELEADSGYIYDSVRKLTKAGVESCSLQEMPVGTVILSSRAPIGKVAIAGNTFYCNQGFKNIICKEGITPRYLYTVLLLNVEYLNSLGRGATFKEISKGIVENIRIPVPAIDLQEQFVAFVEQTDKSKFLVSKVLNTLYKWGEVLERI